MFKDRVSLYFIHFVGEAAALIHAQHQQRHFPFLEDQQGKEIQAGASLLACDCPLLIFE